MLALAALMLAVPLHGADCVYAAVPPASRNAIGAAALGRRKAPDADLKLLVAATDGCATPASWSVEQALHASGSATMRFAADVLASRLGHAAWADAARVSIADLSDEQIARLATRDAGEAELRLVMQRMITADRGIAAALNTAPDATLASFVLMLRFTAIAEAERRKL